MAEIVNNKLIAKNAAILYFRMIITMFVGLYTSRVLLQALGIEDYGIYNVVGGFVSMFSLLSGALQSAIGRFLTYELGKGDIRRLKKVFSTSTSVILGLCVIAILATETIGLWYINNKMILPLNRLYAANWVFQFSIVSFVITIVNTTFQSCILSHEKMNIYAYMAIFDAFAKLIICYLILISSYDRLIVYSVLFCMISIIDQLISVWYCSKSFEECTFRFEFDNKLFKEIFGFAGWTFVGSSASILRTQGAALLLNAFGGPIVNAANGIATNVSNVVLGFVSNFTMAFNPQIVKLFASGEYIILNRLIFLSSKFSYFLMYLISLPILLNTNYILNLWLGEVPQYTVEFTRWMFVMLLSETITRPLMTLKSATGRIKNYQLIVGSILLLMLPISYIGLKMGMSVMIVVIVNGLTAVIAASVRIFLINGDFPGWSIIAFLREVVVKALLVSISSAIVPLIISSFIPEGVERFLITLLTSLIFTLISVFFLGCSVTERQYVMTRISEYFRNKRLYL